MSDSGREAWRTWEEGGPERLYVITGSLKQPIEGYLYDLVTLVVSHSGPKPGMHPEQAAILRMCVTPLSIAEISAYLSLPASTVTVLVADLVTSGQAEARAAASMDAHPGHALLEAVIDGLSKI